MGTFEFSVIVAVLILFTLISRRIQSTPFTAPIIFVGCGALLGPTFLGLLRYSFDAHAIHTLAELTLVLLLFTDAAKINIWYYRANRALPRRLLAIGLPLTRGRPEEHTLSFAEDTGEFLSYLTWIIFGAAVVGPALVAATVLAVLYAVLSLTVVRMVPVAISMIGSGERPDTVAFLGWFGPRGLASVMFAIIVVHGAGIAGQTRTEPGARWPVWRRTQAPREAMKSTAAPSGVVTDLARASPVRVPSMQRRPSHTGEFVPDEASEGGGNHRSRVNRQPPRARGRGDTQLARWMPWSQGWV